MLRGLNAHKVGFENVVDVPQGDGTDKAGPPKDDVWKEKRHRLVKQVVCHFYPFLLYSGDGLESGEIGEQTVHALRELNPDAEIEFVYLAGAENEETIRRVARNLKQFSQESNLDRAPNHQLSLAIHGRNEFGKALDHAMLKKIMAENGLDGASYVIGDFGFEENSTHFRDTADPTSVPILVSAVSRREGWYGFKGAAFETAQNIVSVIQKEGDETIEDLLPAELSDADLGQIAQYLEKYFEADVEGLHQARALMTAAWIYERRLNQPSKAAELENKAVTEIRRAIRAAVEWHSGFGSRHELKFRTDVELVESDAPVRLDITSASGSDLIPISMEKRGRVLNVAVNLGSERTIYTGVRVIPQPVIRVRSVDTASEKTFASRKELELEGNSDQFSIVKMALLVTGILRENDTEPLEATLQRMGGGLEIITDARNVPMGSGLGVSSILAATVLAVLRTITNQIVNREMLVGDVLQIEQMIGVLGGWQDPVGGIWGEFKEVFSKTSNPIPETKPFEVSAKIKKELKDRMVLLYLGTGHQTRSILKDMIRDYLIRDKKAFNASLKSRQIGNQIFDALAKGDIDLFGSLLSEYWTVHKEVVGPDVTTDWIEEIFKQVNNLINGGKVSGAGGGGFMVLVAKEGKKAALIQRLEEISRGTEARVYDYDWDDEGLRIGAVPNRSETRTANDVSRSAELNQPARLTVAAEVTDQIVSAELVLGMTRQEFRIFFEKYFPAVSAKLSQTKISKALKIFHPAAQISDRYILGADLAVGKNFLNAAEQLFSGQYAAILAKDEFQAREIQKQIDAKGLKNMKAFGRASDAVRYVSKQGVQVRAWFTAEDSDLADEVRQAVPDTQILTLQQIYQFYQRLNLQALANGIYTRFMVMASA